MESFLDEVKGNFEIRNKLGMHARAAAVFVQLANDFNCEIRVSKGGVEVNGKSIMGVLQLAAVKGDTIEIVASGEDCQKALTALDKLIGDYFGEEE